MNEEVDEKRKTIFWLKCDSGVWSRNERTPEFLFVNLFKRSKKWTEVDRKEGSCECKLDANDRLDFIHRIINTMEYERKQMKHIAVFRKPAEFAQHVWRRCDQI